MDLDMRNKTYLVMAASRGLGRAAADAVRSEGGRVLTTSRTPGETFVLDTGDRSSRELFLHAVAGERLSGLFVNTGGPKGGGVLALSDEDWEVAFAQILLGPIHLVRGLLPQMERGGSVLINASSSVAQPIPQLALSNVLRAGLHALVKTLVDELAPHGIRINLIVPGRIDTDRVRDLDRSVAARTSTDEDAVRRASQARIPLQRYGEPAEFGRLAAFLLSPLSSYLNGAAYWVDGGQNRGL